MRWPLRYQILFPFVGVMLAVVLGVSLLDALLAARRTQRRIEHQLNEVAKTLLDGNFPLTDAVLKQTRGLSGAEFLLVDLRNQVQASSLDEVDPAAIPHIAGGDGQFQLGDPIRFGGREYLHTAINLAPRGTTSEAMLLHILYPQGLLREARWEAAYPPLVVGSLLLVVVVVLAIVIANRLSRPILELRRQLDRLVQGDFQPLDVPARNDELRDLICSVNSLGDQLDEFSRAITRSERLALLGQLSGGLAHQLRNTVAGARIATQLHKRHCREVDQDSLAVALRQLAMTESHLQRFLTAGQPTVPRRTRCDLQGVIADVAALVAPSCAHRNVDLQLPDRAESGHQLCADAEQLRQLLMNLVLNGIEAAGPGGWVRIELARSAGATKLRVLDCGPGPQRDLEERLFEPFATGKPEGIGLGLTVARQIVEAHGGTIRYVKQGATCFEVTLPASDGELNGTAASAATDDDAGAEAQAEQSRI
ncbi:MAG: HAMP domain-containing sensor histidine kinase [Pirellulales bacterium]